MSSEIKICSTVKFGPPRSKLSVIIMPVKIGPPLFNGGMLMQLRIKRRYSRDKSVL